MACFRWTFCLGLWNSLKMEADNYFETSTPAHQYTWRHTLKTDILIRTDAENSDLKFCCDFPLLTIRGTGQRSRCSDLLRSGVPNPVEASNLLFSMSFQTGLAADPTSPTISTGEVKRSVCGVDLQPLSSTDVNL